MDVIKGVSVISVGEAKGHGLFVDAQTLLEVKACAESYSGGVKVNLDHGAGIKDIIGLVTNFRITGEKLIADLHLLESADRRAYVLEIAEKLPDTFGISIAFSGPVREISGRKFASCTELYSADLVQTPAANPTGLFSFEVKSDVVEVDKKTELMDNAPENPEDAPEMEKDPMTEVLSRLAAIEAFVADYNKKMEDDSVEPVEEVVETEAKEEPAADLSRLEAKMDSIIANFGAKPMKASAAVEVKAEPAFDLRSVIAAKAIELGSKTAAIKFAMANHPAEYLDLRNSNQLINL
jgi:hypothetical protein